MAYYCVVWDEMGCMQEGSPFQYVQVLPVGIGEVDNQKNVEVYTTTDGITVNLNGISEPMLFHLWDIQGRFILSYEIQESERIPVTGIGKGVFLYTIRDAKGAIQSGRLLLD